MYRTQAWQSVPTLTTVFLPSLFWLASPTRCVSLPSSVLDRITVPTPLLWIVSITARASSSDSIFSPVSNSASNWLGRQTSASGRIVSWYTGSRSWENMSDMVRVYWLYLRNIQARTSVTHHWITHIDERWVHRFQMGDYFTKFGKKALGANIAINDVRVVVDIVCIQAIHQLL